jgi:hypothetical protein
MWAASVPNPPRPVIGPSIEVPATPAYAATARLFAAAAARHFGVGEADVDDARLAVSEVFTAALVSAPSGSMGPVQLDVTPAADGLVAFRVDLPGTLPPPAEAAGVDASAGGEGFAVPTSFQLVWELFPALTVEPGPGDRTVVAFHVPVGGAAALDEQAPEP